MNTSQFEAEKQAPVPDRDAIEGFLRDTIRDAFHLAYIPEGKTPVCQSFGNDAAAAADWAVTANERGHNVYFTFNRAPGGLNRKPSAADIVAARFAFADIDPPKDGQPFNIKVQLDALENDRFPPSVVVASGGGLQAYWRIEESENLSAIAELGRGIAHKLAADSCANVDRLARLPGTVNYPDARKRARGRTPCIASVLVPDTGQSYEPSDLAAHFPAPADKGEAERANVVLPQDIEPLTLSAMGLSETSLMHAIEKPAGDDRSAFGYHAVAEAVRCGLPDSEIASLLLNPANAAAAHFVAQSRPLRAIERAIGKARSAENIAEGEIPHIRDIPQIDFSALIANGIAKARAKVANDNGALPGGGTVPFTFVRVSDLRHREPQWLVKGLLEESSLALLFGDPGCGKSFLAIDLASSVATGFPFHDRETKQGAVFYIAGEGHGGLRRRFAAWEQGNSTSLDGQPLFVSQRAANLYDAESAREVADAIDALAAQHGSPRLIVVDTLARSFGGGDENSTKDMNAFVIAMDNLKARYRQATILLVHHTGHAEKGRARGSMALKGALDVEYKVAKTGNAITLTNEKMKEAATPAPIGFQAVEVTLGHYRDGEAYSSIYLIENGSIIDGLTTNKPVTGNAAIGLQVFRHVAERLGRKASEGIPKDDWRAAFYEAVDTDSKRSAFHRALQTLCETVPNGPADLCFVKDGLRLASDPREEA